MKLNNTFIVCLFIFLSSCAGYEKTKSQKSDNRIYYSSNGFALVYEDILYKNKIVNKKINNEEIMILHNLLKRNTPIRITNLKNNKYLDLKVSKKANYPKIFNIVISKKLALILDLDINNPLVEILELKKNKTFIAKEGNIFDEEKNVANKAPVDEIEMNVLTKDETKLDEKKIEDKYFVIKISDFYYKNSAIGLKNELSKKIKPNLISIRKINNTKYRLLVGPFKNFNALKTTYISLNNLGFESLNVYNE